MLEDGGMKFELELPPAVGRRLQAVAASYRLKVGDYLPRVIVREIESEERRSRLRSDQTLRSVRS